MVDTNAPIAWRVIDRRTNKIIAQYPYMHYALAKCEELEPHPNNHTGPMYIMEPVRRVDAVSTPPERNDG